MGLAEAAGQTDGTGAEARLSVPEGVAWDNANEALFVADTGNCVLRCVVVRRGCVHFDIGPAR